MKREEKSQYLPLSGLVMVQSTAAQQQLIQYQTHFPAIGFKPARENERTSEEERELTVL